MKDYVSAEIRGGFFVNIKCFRYNDISNTDNGLLNNLIRSVWEDTDTSEIHPKEMNAVSFCAKINDIFIGYAGVIDWNIRVRNKIFKMCALSCVCTQPSYRKKGTGSYLVKKATEWIIKNDSIDVGLFTCSQENTGCWERAPRLILKESDRNRAYRSDIMGLNVFKLLVSNRAKSHAEYFENGIINLNFPEGKFI